MRNSLKRALLSGVKLLPEHHCALAAGQVLTEGS